MLELIRKSSLAGLLISLAGAIYLNCENKIVGAFLFSIGLIAVIILEAHLVTGKFGYINNKQKLLDSLIILGVNLVTAFICGMLYKLCVGESQAMDTRLTKEWYRLLFDGIGCGALIYLAVQLKKKYDSIIPVIICVMAFILGSMEHCVADAFYFGACALTWEGLLAVGIVVVGNAIGSLLIRFLEVGYENFKS